MAAASSSSCCCCAVSRGLRVRGRCCLFGRSRGIRAWVRRSVGGVTGAESSRADESDEKDAPRDLRSLLAERQEQAERSVLISCRGATDEKFHKHLSKHGTVNRCFFYEHSGLNAVVEFSSRDGVASLMEASSIPASNSKSSVPYKSRLLTLRNAGSVRAAGVQIRPPCESLSMPPVAQLIKRLSRLQTIDQQIQSLTETSSITEENSRLRFLVCSLLRDVVTAYFPGCSVRPFGSSVNGFGKLGCDLDMFLDIDSISGGKQTTKASGLVTEFQVKQTKSERAVTQSILSVIGECVDHFGPGCVGVHKILNARCPLVRFVHQPSSFQCDLTTNNRVAMKSTELLYLYGELDPRVRGLVFTLRCWARVHGVTSSIPGAWISNFSLTLMVLFFLQRRSPPVIPALDQLRLLAGPEDKSVIEGNDCTFVSDFSKIRATENMETLEWLLNEFFQFYATFPFSLSSISIRRGKELVKPEVAPLHIQNPFETSLNVSQNVNGAQVERFVALCQESSWLLQHNKVPKGKQAGGEPWGLASLLMPSQVAGIKTRQRKQERASQRIRDLLDSLKGKQQESSG